MQRLFEVVLAGSLPLCPGEFCSAHRLIPEPLIVASGTEATDTITELSQAGAATRAEMLAACLERLDPMRVSHQVKTLNELLTVVNR